MTFLVIAYVLIGVIVYAFTDTATIASHLSRPLLGPSYGAVQKYLFPAIVAFWPLWLIVRTLKAKS